MSNAGSGTAGESADAGAGGSASEPDGTADPESACDTPGELACAGNHQRVTLVCSGGIWAVNDVCAEDDVCDSAPGVNQGSCRPVLSECADHEPGYAFCDGPTTLRTCGPDNATLDAEECTGSCFDDACDDRVNFCPGVPFVNCGEECGEPEGCGFTVFGCAKEKSLLFDTGDIGDSLLVRTADYESSCAVLPCESHGLQLQVRANYSSLKLKVTIASPWRLVRDSCSAAGAQCLIWESPGGPNSSLNLMALTDDPSAAEHNITFQVADLEDPLDCP